MGVPEAGAPADGGGGGEIDSSMTAADTGSDAADPNDGFTSDELADRVVRTQRERPDGPHALLRTTVLDQRT